MPQLVSDEQYALLQPSEGISGEQPELTSLATGGFISSWRDDGAIFAQFFDASGAPVGDAFQIAAAGSDVDIASLPSGGFIAAWYDVFQGIVVGTFDAAGNLTATSVISDAPNESGIAPYGRFQQPSVAILSSGNFVVAFSVGDDGNSGGIRAQLFNANGDKIGADFSVNSVTLGEQSYPLVVSLPSGGFLISWADNFSGSHGAQIYDSNGNEVGGQIEIAPGAVGVFDIAVLQSGNIVVVWAGSDGELRGQLYTSGGLKSGAEFPINAASAGQEILPDVAALPSGGFVVTWRSPTEGVNYFQMGDIRAQRFDANGGKVGEEFLISTGTPGAKRSASRRVWIR